MPYNVDACKLRCSLGSGLLSTFLFNRNLWGQIQAGARGKVACLYQGGILVAFQDKTLVCRECANEFTFTAGEQEFYQQRGLVHEPARCPTCRADRRRMRSGYDSGPRAMYPAVCASCGKETEVPFQPRLGRPVYLSLIHI